MQKKTSTNWYHNLLLSLYIYRQINIQQTYDSHLKNKNALILGHTNTNTHKTHAHKHRNKRTHKHEHSRFVKLESHDWVSSLVENTISFNKSQAHLYKLKQQLKCKWRNWLNLCNVRFKLWNYTRVTLDHFENCAV